MVQGPDLPRPAFRLRRGNGDAKFVRFPRLFPDLLGQVSRIVVAVIVVAEVVVAVLVLRRIVFVVADLLQLGGLTE